MLNQAVIRLGSPLASSKTACLTDYGHDADGLEPVY
jgi:hypothetical protein